MDLTKDHEATLIALERFLKELDPERLDATWLVRTVIQGQLQDQTPP
jgi:hypothetical protein